MYFSSLSTFIWWALVFLNMLLVPATYVLNSTLGPALGRPLNPKAAAEGEKILSESLAKIESVWLKGNGRFLLGSLQPSIADLSLVCEIMQLEVNIYVSFFTITDMINNNRLLEK